MSGVDLSSEFSIQAVTQEPSVSTSISQSTPTSASQLRPRKLKFSEDVTVHHYDNVTDDSQSDSSSNDSELIDLDSVLEMRHSDDLFNTDTESENEEPRVKTAIRGRKAIKKFEVKFGSIS